MNWKDIIKNQITIGRQKLRSSKRPLPDEEDSSCKEEFMDIFNQLKAIENDLKNLDSEYFEVRTEETNTGKHLLISPSIEKDAVILAMFNRNDLHAIGEPPEEAFCHALKMIKDSSEKTAYFGMYYVDMDYESPNWRGVNRKLIVISHKHFNGPSIRIGYEIAPFREWPAYVINSFDKDVRRGEGNAGHSLTKYLKSIYKIEDLVGK